MKFKGKEIKILYVKFKHKETDRNRQKQTETDMNRQKQAGTDRNIQDQISNIDNYCIIKKFISHVGNLETNTNSYLM